MDTELLKTFLEVSRTRHFGRAAEALYLTQSAVSFRIRQLENQLGVNLFTRHRNNIRLTPAGEKLLPYAETLMNTWQAARKEVAHTSRHNEFSIGASASLWECMLSQWLSRLYHSHGHLQFEARIAQRQSLVKQLHERQLDLLITTEAPKMDEFSSQIAYSGLESVVESSTVWSPGLLSAQQTGNHVQPFSKESCWQAISAELVVSCGTSSGAIKPVSCC